MATMIPPDVEDFATNGERQFYSFLQSVAKPDPAFIVWYCPDVEGREPDFIVYHDQVGLLIFEVKDWSLHQIIEADPKRFKLTINGAEESRTNPLEQAHQYRTQVFQAIQHDGHLLSRDPAHYGKLRVPVSTAAVFTNINKHEFVKQGLDRVVDPAHAFFWDDLHPQSPYCTDTSGRTFREALQRRFPPLFPFSLSGQDRNHLRNLLFPQVRVQTVRRPVQPEFEAHNQTISALDHHQEVFARKFDSGHYLIKGRSGSGKTLVLVHKAALLLRYNPKVQRILYVCYNLALVPYVRRLLAQLRVPLGDPGVEVLPFYSLCERIVGSSVDHQDPDGGDYYQLINEEALARSPDHPKYDAVMLDEAMDFSDEMLRVVVNLLNPGTNNLTIALDEQQNIYAKKQSWRKLGINIRGRVRQLDHVYRSTRELTHFAARFAGQSSEPDDPQQDLFPSSFDFSGPQPEVRQLADFQSLIGYVADTIVELADHGYGSSEIAVIYISKDLAGQEQPLPVLIQTALNHRGVLSTWLSQDVRSKATYDITTDTVTISTAHSVKGLDYAAVFVVGLDLVEPGDRWNADQLEKIAYVAITRARYRLFIPFLAVTRIIKKTLASAGIT